MRPRRKISSWPAPSRDESGVSRIDRRSSIPPMPPPVRLLELHDEAPGADRRYVDHLLGAVIAQGAAHAQVVTRGGRPWTRYCVDGRWQSTRVLPPEVASKLAAELRILVSLGDSSCPDDRSHTFRMHVPGRGPRLFRVHHQGAGLLVVSPIEGVWARRRTEIIDRQRRLRQERLVVRGEIAFAEGRVADALVALRSAVDLAEGIERPAWLTRVQVQIARCHEAAGEILRAESAYKRAIRIIEERYGREDGQRMRLFTSLAQCAARRGDREVEAMWSQRASRLGELLLDGC